MTVRILQFGVTGQVGQELLRQAETREVAPTADWPTPAARPARGVLDTASLEAAFGVTPRGWRPALSEIIGELSDGERA